MIQGSSAKNTGLHPVAQCSAQSFKLSFKTIQTFYCNLNSLTVKLKLLKLNKTQKQCHFVVLFFSLFKGSYNTTYNTRY